MARPSTITAFFGGGGRRHEHRAAGGVHGVSATAVPPTVRPARHARDHGDDVRKCFRARRHSLSNACGVS